jgi:hypothetical protein
MIGYLLLIGLTLIVLAVRRLLRNRMSGVTVPVACKVGSLIVLHIGVFLVLGFADTLKPGVEEDNYWLTGLGGILFSVGFWAALIPRRKSSK